MAADGTSYASGRGDTLSYGYDDDAPLHPPALCLVIESINPQYSLHQNFQPQQIENPERVRFQSTVPGFGGNRVGFPAEGLGIGLGEGLSYQNQHQQGHGHFMNTFSGLSFVTAQHGGRDTAASNNGFGSNQHHMSNTQMPASEGRDVEEHRMALNNGTALTGGSGATSGAAQHTLFFNQGQPLHHADILGSYSHLHRRRSNDMMITPFNNHHYYQPSLAHAGASTSSPLPFSPTSRGEDGANTSRTTSNIQQCVLQTGQGGSAVGSAVPSPTSLLRGDFRVTEAQESSNVQSRRFSRGQGLASAVSFLTPCTSNPPREMEAPVLHSNGPAHGHTPVVVSAYANDFTGECAATYSVSGAVGGIGVSNSAIQVSTAEHSVMVSPLPNVSTALSGCPPLSGVGVGGVFPASSSPFITNAYFSNNNNSNTNITVPRSVSRVLREYSAFAGSIGPDISHVAAVGGDSNDVSVVSSHHFLPPVATGIYSVTGVGMGGESGTRGLSVMGVAPASPEAIQQAAALIGSSPSALPEGAAWKGGLVMRSPRALSYSTSRHSEMFLGFGASQTAPKCTGVEGLTALNRGAKDGGLGVVGGGRERERTTEALSACFSGYGPDRVSMIPATGEALDFEVGGGIADASKAGATMGSRSNFIYGSAGIRERDAADSLSPTAAAAASHVMPSICGLPEEALGSMMFPAPPPLPSPLPNDAEGGILVTEKKMTQAAIECLLGGGSTTNTPSHQSHASNLLTTQQVSHLNDTAVASASAGGLFLQNSSAEHSKVEQSVGHQAFLERETAAHSDDIEASVAKLVARPNNFDISPLAHQKEQRQQSANTYMSASSAESSSQLVANASAAAALLMSSIATSTGTNGTALQRNQELLQDQPQQHMFGRRQECAAEGAVALSTVPPPPPPYAQPPSIGFKATEGFTTAPFASLRNGHSGEPPRYTSAPTKAIHNVSLAVTATIPNNNLLDTHQALSSSVFMIEGAKPPAMPHGSAHAESEATADFSIDAAASAGGGVATTAKPVVLYKKIDASGKNLFVSGLHQAVDHRRLKEIFSCFGHINSTRVLYDSHIPSRSKGMGFVHFEHLASVNEAIERFNGMRITVEISTTTITTRSMISPISQSAGKGHNACGEVDSNTGVGGSSGEKRGNNEAAQHNNNTQVACAEGGTEDQPQNTDLEVVILDGSTLIQSITSAAAGDLSSPGTGVGVGVGAGGVLTEETVVIKSLEDPLKSQSSPPQEGSDNNCNTTAHNGGVSGAQGESEAPVGTVTATESSLQTTTSSNTIVIVVSMTLQVKLADDDATFIPEETNKLFIRNVPRTITSQQLATYFGRFGAVVDCTIHRDTSTKGRHEHSSGAVMSSTTADSVSSSPQCSTPQSPFSPQSLAVPISYNMAYITYRTIPEANRALTIIGDSVPWSQRCYIANPNPRDLYSDPKGRILMRDPAAPTVVEDTINKSRLKRLIQLKKYLITARPLAAKKLLNLHRNEYPRMKDGEGRSSPLFSRRVINFSLQAPELKVTGEEESSTVGTQPNLVVINRPSPFAFRYPFPLVLEESSAWRWVEKEMERGEESNGECTAAEENETNMVDAPHSSGSRMMPESGEYIVHEYISLGDLTLEELFMLYDPFDDTDDKEDLVVRMLSHRVQTIIDAATGVDVKGGEGGGEGSAAQSHCSEKSEFVAARAGTSTSLLSSSDLVLREERRVFGVDVPAINLAHLSEAKENGTPSVAPCPLRLSREQCLLLLARLARSFAPPSSLTDPLTSPSMTLSNFAESVGVGESAAISTLVPPASVSSNCPHMSGGLQQHHGNTSASGIHNGGNNNTNNDGTLSIRPLVVKPAETLQCRTMRIKKLQQQQQQGPNSLGHHQPPFLMSHSSQPQHNQSYHHNVRNPQSNPNLSRHPHAGGGMGMGGFTSGINQPFFHHREGTYPLYTSGNVRNHQQPQQQQYQQYQQNQQFAFGRSHISSSSQATVPMDGGVHGGGPAFPNPPQQVVGTAYYDPTRLHPRAQPHRTPPEPFQHPTLPMPPPPFLPPNPNATFAKTNNNNLNQQNTSNKNSSAIYMNVGEGGINSQTASTFLIYNTRNNNNNTTGGLRAGGSHHFTNVNNNINANRGIPAPHGNAAAAFPHGGSNTGSTGGSPYQHALPGHPQPMQQQQQLQQQAFSNTRMPYGNNNNNNTINGHNVTSSGPPLSNFPSNIPNSQQQQQPQGHYNVQKRAEQQAQNIHQQSPHVAHGGLRGNGDSTLKLTQHQQHHENSTGGLGLRETLPRFPPNSTGVTQQQQQQQQYSVGHAALSRAKPIQQQQHFPQHGGGGTVTGFVQQQQGQHNPYNANEGRRGGGYAHATAARPELVGGSSALGGVHTRPSHNQHHDNASMNNTTANPNQSVVGYSQSNSEPQNNYRNQHYLQNNNSREGFRHY